MTRGAVSEDSPYEIVEQNSASFVPLSARHGQVRDLFTLWFTTSIAPFPIVTGASIGLQSHLSLFWAISAILCGHLLGSLVLAACSAQGPQMGLAQMVQARGQFGRYGALLIVSISALLYLGFFTSNTVLAGQALHGLVPVVGIGTGGLLAAFCAVTIGILGYRTIHLLNRVGMWFMATALLAAFACVLARTPASAWSLQGFNTLGWLLCFSTSLVWNTSYACYTSDYSRYLPPSVGLRRPFLASLAGSASGAALSFIFGAVVAASMPQLHDPMQAVSSATGWLGPVLLFLFLLNIISHNALNVYGAVLALITMLQTFIASWEPGRGARIGIAGVVLAGCLGVAGAFADSAVPVFINIVVALLIVLVPWVTINICDFYILCKGQYDIASFFRADGGRYGLFDWPACAAFLIGVAVQLPITANAFFTGPAVHLLHGINIGWLISPPVTLFAFLALRRARDGKRPQ
ncbi:MAG: cytosine permease [Acetobacter sp.]